MKRFLTLALMASFTVIMLTLIGCKPKTPPPPPPPPPLHTPAAVTGKKTVVITMIAKSTTNPVFLAARTGAKQAADDLSAKYGIKVTIDWRTPTTESAQEQFDDIHTAIAKKSDAILISCSDANKVTDAINDAVAAGIPVMTFDSDAPQSKRFACYGTDDLDCGKQVMDTLAKQLGEKGTVAILSGNQSAPNLQKRTKGAQDEAKVYPNIKVVGPFYHAETPKDATNEVTKQMAAHPDIAGWAMIGGWPLMGPGLLDDAKFAKTKTVAVDAIPAQMEYVDKGMVPVLLAQPTYDWGYVSVGIIIDKVSLGKTPPTINKMTLVPVTKDGANGTTSLKDWATKLVSWGFGQNNDSDKQILDKFTGGAAPGPGTPAAGGATAPAAPAAGAPTKPATPAPTKP